MEQRNIFRRASAPNALESLNTTSLIITDYLSIRAEHYREIFRDVQKYSQTVTAVSALRRSYCNMDQKF